MKAKNAKKLEITESSSEVILHCTSSIFINLEVHFAKEDCALFLEEYNWSKGQRRVLKNQPFHSCRNQLELPRNKTNAVYLLRLKDAASVHITTVSAEPTQISNKFSEIEAWAPTGVKKIEEFSGEVSSKESFAIIFQFELSCESDTLFSFCLNFSEETTCKVVLVNHETLSETRIYNWKRSKAMLLKQGKSSLVCYSSEQASTSLSWELMCFSNEDSFQVQENSFTEAPISVKNCPFREDWATSEVKRHSQQVKIAPSHANADLILLNMHVSNSCFLEISVASGRSKLKCSLQYDEQSIQRETTNGRLIFPHIPSGFQLLVEFDRNCMEMEMMETFPEINLNIVSTNPIEIKLDEQKYLEFDEKKKAFKDKKRMEKAEQSRTLNSESNLPSQPLAKLKEILEGSIKKTQTASANFLTKLKDIRDQESLVREGMKADHETLRNERMDWNQKIENILKIANEIIEMSSQKALEVKEVSAFIENFFGALESLEVPEWREPRMKQEGESLSLILLRKVVDREVSEAEVIDDETFEKFKMFMEELKLVLGKQEFLKNCFKKLIHCFEEVELAEQKVQAFETLKVKLARTDAS